MTWRGYHHFRYVRKHSIGQLPSKWLHIHKRRDTLWSNWWYTYPPEKYEFVRLDHHPNYWGFNKIPWFQTTNHAMWVQWLQSYFLQQFLVNPQHPLALSVDLFAVALGHQAFHQRESKGACKHRLLSISLLHITITTHWSKKGITHTLVILSTRLSRDLCWCVHVCFYHISGNFKAFIIDSGWIIMIP